MHDTGKEIAEHGLVGVDLVKGKDEASLAIVHPDGRIEVLRDHVALPKKIGQAEADDLVAALVEAGAKPPQPKPEPRPRLRARVAALQAESATRREAREKHRQEVERVQAQLREERQRQRDEERKRIAQERGAAFEADRALRDALKDVDGAFAIYETTRKEGASLIAEAAQREEAARLKAEAAWEAWKNAETAWLKAQQDTGSAEQMFDVESSRAAYDEALGKAKDAVKQADRAWQATPKAFRKAHRNRALRKRARDLGLTTAPGEE